MNKQVLVVYKSVTGFTKQYAQWIAEALHCETMDLKEASSTAMSNYQTIIFGGRFHAGFVDGLKKAKALFGESAARRLVIFGTGATLGTQIDMINEAWKNNLTPEELNEIPHFYMESGLRQEKMPLGDKLMLKVFAAMVKGKKEKTEYEKAMAQALGESYDHSSREFIKPLVECVRQEGRNM